jgi:hypothetical protein
MKYKQIAVKYGISVSRNACNKGIGSACNCDGEQRGHAHINDL